MFLVMLQYLGIVNVKITSIGPISLTNVFFREKWLEKLEKLGRNLLQTNHQTDV